MSVINVDAIEARTAAATPGPWKVHGRLPSCVVEDREIKKGEPWRRVVTDTTRENAAFIAAARTDVPALCARVRELEASAAVMREALRNGLVGGVMSAETCKRALATEAGRALAERVRLLEAVAVMARSLAARVEARIASNTKFTPASQGGIDGTVFEDARAALAALDAQGKAGGQ